MINRKLAKLFSNPNLFFYDLFKKRVFKNAATYKMNNLESGMENPSSLVNDRIACVDIFSIQKNGIYNYLQENLKCAFAPEDGIDSNSLLMWSGYLNGLLTLIGDMRKMLSLNVTIYTMGGGFNHKSNVSDSFDIRLLSSKLSNRPDFVVEMSNELGELFEARYKDRHRLENRSRVSTCITNS